MTKNKYEWHANALKGHFGNANKLDPQPGYYSMVDDKTGTRVPAAIWYDKHDTILASVGYECIDTSPHSLWKRVWMTPINEDDYYSAIENGDALPSPDSSNAAALLLSDIEIIIHAAQPLLDPELTNLVADVDARNQLGDIAAQLTEFANRATALQKAEMDPINDQLDAVRKRWRPAQERASVAAKEMKSALGSALKIVKPTAEELGIEAKTKAGTGRARAIGLRSVKVVKIFDRHALVKQIMSMNEPLPEFEEVLEKIARRMLSAGAKVDGARFEIEEIAA